MSDRQAQELARRNLVRERRLGRDRVEENVFAAELQRAVTNQRPRQEPSFAKDLEPVADAEHKTPIGCKTLHRLHHRTEARDCAGAQIIAVAETARDDDCISIAQGMFLVPHQPSRMAEHVPQNFDGVLVAI